MSEKTFEYLEYVCANTPARQHYMLILELVKHTLDAYINHEGFVHVYPQWLPEDLETPMPRELLLDRSKIDHVILHDVGIIEAVPASEKAGPSDVL